MAGPSPIMKWPYPGKRRRRTIKTVRVYDACCTPTGLIRPSSASKRDPVLSNGMNFSDFDDARAYPAYDHGAGSLSSGSILQRMTRRVLEGVLTFGRARPVVRLCHTGKGWIMDVNALSQLYGSDRWPRRAELDAAASGSSYRMPCLMERVRLVWRDALPGARPFVPAASTIATTTAA